jgi:hypothetical protein
MEITPPARRYCEELHKESGPKQNKAITQKKGEYVKDHREIVKDDEEYRNRRKIEQFRVRNGLTVPKLRTVFNQAEAQQEYDPHSKYDVYQFAFDALDEIKRLLCNPPADLPSTAALVNKKAEDSLRSLQKIQQEARSDSEINRLILCFNEVQLNTGQWMSQKVFPAIRRKAKWMFAQCKELHEPLGLIHVLLFNMRGRGIFTQPLIEA